MSANWRWTSSAVRPSHSVTCLTSRAHGSCSICSALQNCTSSSRNHIPQPHFQKQYSSTSLPEMTFCPVHVLITPASHSGPIFPPIHRCTLHFYFPFFFFLYSFSFFSHILPVFNFQFLTSSFYLPPFSYLSLKMA
jgi:hypothetical protein